MCARKIIYHIHEYETVCVCVEWCLPVFLCAWVLYFAFSAFCVSEKTIKIIIISCLSAKVLVCTDVLSQHEVCVRIHVL